MYVMTKWSGSVLETGPAVHKLTPINPFTSIHHEFKSICCRPSAEHSPYLLYQ